MSPPTHDANRTQGRQLERAACFTVNLAQRVFERLVEGGDDAVDDVR